MSDDTDDPMSLVIEELRARIKELEGNAHVMAVQSVIEQYNAEHQGRITLEADNASLIARLEMSEQEMHETRKALDHEKLQSQMLRDVVNDVGRGSTHELVRYFLEKTIQLEKELGDERERSMGHNMSLQHANLELAREKTLCSTFAKQITELQDRLAEAKEDVKAARRERMELDAELKEVRGTAKLLYASNEILESDLGNSNEELWRVDVRNAKMSHRLRLQREISRIWQDRTCCAAPEPSAHERLTVCLDELGAEQARRLAAEAQLAAVRKAWAKRELCIPADQADMNAAAPVRAIISAGAQALLTPAPSPGAGEGTER